MFFWIERMENLKNKIYQNQSECKSLIEKKSKLTNSSLKKKNLKI